jgi:hypothetical protein
VTYSAPDPLRIYESYADIARDAPSWMLVDNSGVDQATFRGYISVPVFGKPARPQIVKPSSSLSFGVPTVAIKPSSSLQMPLMMPISPMTIPVPESDDDAEYREALIAAENAADLPSGHEQIMEYM